MAGVETPFFLPFRPMVAVSLVELGEVISGTRQALNLEEAITKIFTFAKKNPACAGCESIRFSLQSMNIL